MRTNGTGSMVALMQFFNVGVKTKAISQPLGATIIFMAIIVLSLGQFKSHHSTDRSLTLVDYV